MDVARPHTPGIALKVCYHVESMKRLKRLFYLTLFNILVSATTTLAVLYGWDLGKEKLAEMQRLAALTPSAPAVTVIVVNTGSEATAAVETLGITAAPTLTPTPAPPTPPSQSYRIQEGDTLAIVADRFEVTLQDILAINDLNDPNNLFIGQEIFIPTGPLPTLTPSDTSTVTATPSATPTPRQTRPPSATPTPSPGSPVVAIESVLGVGDLSAEKVRIVLRSGQDISLSGWRLSDSDGNRYTFPQLDLFAGGAVHLNSRTGLDTANDLYWGKAAPVWQHGETVVLQDAEGNQQAVYEIP